MKDFSNTSLANLWRGIKILTVIACFGLGLILCVVGFGFMFHDDFLTSAVSFFIGTGFVCASFGLTKTIEDKDAEYGDEDTQTVFYFEN